MNYKNILFIVISGLAAVILIPSTLYAQTDKPITRTLDELVVESKNLYIEGGKVIGIPEKREKNLASDATSLLQNMNMPVIRIINGEVLSYSGNEITYFINYKPVTGLDMQMFWPQDVIRVEYVEDSDDPRFMGCFPAVNFIMKVYEVGGVVRANAQQTFPNSGRYDIGAKLVYKRMTFQAFAVGGYSRDHSSSSENTETYRDITYNGIKYDEVMRKTSSYGQAQRSNNTAAAFDAVYTAPKFTAQHNVSFDWRQNPESQSCGSLDITPELFSGSHYELLNNSLNITPTIRGNYNYNHSNKVSSWLGWRYSHSHNKASSTYSVADMTAIKNSTSEDVNNMSIGGNFSYMINPKFMISVTPKVSHSWFTTDYSGSYGGRQTLSQGQTNLFLVGSYNPNSNMSLMAVLGATANYWDVNTSESYTQWRPAIDINWRWNTSRKNILKVSLKYYQQPSATSSINDVIQKETELLWLQGTPNLKGHDSYNIRIGDYFLSSKWLNVMFSGYYSYDKNNKCVTYKTQDGFDGLIKQYHNGGDMHVFGADIYLGFNLLNNSLRLGPQLQYNYYLSTGLYRNHISRFRPRFQGQYYFKSFMVWLEYSYEQRYLRYGGAGEGRYPHQLDFGLKWGNKHWQVEVTGKNLLYRHLDLVDFFNTPLFSSVSHNYAIGRSATIRVTYSFGYGKRVNPNININAGNDQISTSVIGNE